jgi:hypothetical protein
MECVQLQLLILSLKFISQDWQQCFWHQFGIFLWRETLREWSDPHLPKHFQYGPISNSLLIERRKNVLKLRKSQGPEHVNKWEIHEFKLSACTLSGTKQYSHSGCGSLSSCLTTGLAQIHFLYIEHGHEDDCSLSHFPKLSQQIA